MIQKIFLLLLFLFTIRCGTTINPDTKNFEVKNGDTISHIANRLNNENIIDNKSHFKLLAKVTGQANKVKIGIYKISSSISYMELIDIISSGISVNTSITIPEGYNSFQIAALLEKKGIIKAQDFLSEIIKNKYLIKFNLPTNYNPIICNVRYFSDYNDFEYAVPIPSYPSIEGYLFPDTYSLHKNMDASNIVNIFTKRFFQIIDSNILNHIKIRNKNLNEVITLASIIQKEAVNNNEMPKVSGVYKNRLNRNMILQADPTLIYALILDGEYHGNIKIKHLRPPWPSPYNTYYVNTLPSGPIANPGKAAILAVLHPEQHHYLYFVGNPEGTHTYSYTLREHNKAVDTWVQYRKGK